MASTPCPQAVSVWASKADGSGAHRQRGVHRGALLLLLTGAAILSVVPFRADAAEARLVASPDGRLQVSIQMPAPSSTERPCWSASFQGKLLLTNCSLGLQTSDAGELLAGVRFVRERSLSMDKRIPVLFGKADHANDRFRETRFTFENPKHRPLDVTFRCYNDAVAFRYELPNDSKAGSVTVTDETTSFRVEGDPTAYAQYLESYTTSHEHNVAAVSYRELTPGALLDLPLTFSWNDGTYAAVTEAALRHYAGMSLMRPQGEGLGKDLVCKLTPRPDGTKVARLLPMQTPWRVVLVGDRAGALLESSTLYCLNEPSVIKDVSWIKPGKITFSWWNGDVYDGTRTLPILSLAMAKKYIDFCARNGIATHSLTSDEVNVSPWYFQSKLGVAPGPDTDVTRPRADFDLPAIRRYAESKHVRLWTWVHQGALRGRVEEALTAFEKMGWSGMMVDFFDHDDQESIEFAESILQSAARHHIMIHFHGVWKPSGWQRTYPNLMNHEGALNLEYLKWSDRCTPEHNLNLAFTRLIAGPMDYHLGGFRAVTRAEFKPRNIAPNVLGTRCHHLAMYVCFDNPNPMIADYPAAYEGQPGFDFLKLVPTWWDETRVLQGKVGELLVTARRRSRTWYLGCMSAKQARDLALPLGFLDAGQYEVELWNDAPDAEVDPNHLVTETHPLTPTDTLKVHVAMDGGFVARLTPAPR
ncbi:MAG TPA: glycoside hydrolase family 97 protein [Candidatus Acidoferrum sp.]|jgi:alpha-glucosidase|nr:glycoside hydrolase family 97 protein [Candidatus Acidoferrum sp.]